MRFTRSRKCSAEPSLRRRRLARGVAGRALALAAITITVRLTGCMEGLFYHPHEGSTPAPAGAEAAWFESSDGTRLFGWWIPADGSDIDDERPSPTVLHVHGNAGNIESHAWFSEHLPQAGFNVFLFDYRGYGQSEGSARRRGPLIADTEAALRYVLSRNDVEPTRIGMYGHSLGGSIGLNVMANHPQIRAAVIESAFTSWREEAASAIGGDPPAWWARCLAWLVISDRDRPDRAIARIDRPILILHGTDDSIVPVSHGRRLSSLAGGPVELVQLERGDHNTLKETHPVIERLMIEFFERHLPASDLR